MMTIGVNTVASNRNLTPYQLIHLLKLRQNGLNGLLVADGVGVGKTISAGYVIEFVLDVMGEHCIICCPPVLEEKWIQELQSRFGRTAYSVKAEENFALMLEEMGSKEVIPPRAYVLPYSTITQRNLSQMASVGCIILDEIHHARNKETQLYSKLLELSRMSTYKLGLSATPIHNSLDDLISIFSILFPIVEIKVWEYVLREIWAKKSVQILHPFITKFDKQELGIHFTKRNIHQIEIDLPASFHRLVESSIEKKGVSKGTMLTAFEKSIFYRLSTSSPRAFFNSLGRNTPEDYRDHKIEILHDLILGQPSCRWVIFTEFTETAELIKDTLIDRSPHIISGDSSFAERYLAIDNFRKNPEGVLIMMPVGCEGLDLQICSKLVNYDLHWNPMVIEQRIGRIDRIGQAKKSIDVYNFVITGSIDHHMLSIMNEKLGIVSDTFAGIEPIINKEESMAKNAEDIFFDSVDLSKFNLLNEIAASLPKLDYDLQNLLASELCDTTKWPRKIENWDGPKGLVKSIEAHKILSEIRQNSFEIYNILSDYS